MFAPAASAKETQRVCGPACRLARDRTLGRARRRREPEVYRAEERARQAACRARRSEEECHAGASAAKSLTSLPEVQVIVARILKASRTTLERELRLIVVRSGSASGAAPARVTNRPRSASTGDSS